MNFSLQCPICGERFMMMGFALRHKCRVNSEYSKYMADLRYELEHPEEPAPAPLPKLGTKSSRQPIVDDEPTRVYRYLRYQCANHARECGLCRSVAEQDIVCPDLEEMRRLRDKWLVKSSIVATD